MKKLLFTLLLISSYAISSWAQNFVMRTDDDMDPGKPCDSCIIKASYIMKFVKDTTASPVKPSQETMMLDLGKKVSQFYSYKAFICDSVFYACLKCGMSSDELMNETRKYGSSEISWRLYKNINGSGTTTLLESIGMERFRCNENDARPKWELCADTLTIIGYLCHKATTTFKGRKWTAWYTSDIPISEGPWKLCGLPGLILKAEDSQSYYSFEANGIKKVKAQLLFYNGDKYEQIKRKDLNKIYERYYADPAGFVTTNPNVTMTFYDEHGNVRSSPKNYPYNPIEK